MNNSKFTALTVEEMTNTNGGYIDPRTGIRIIVAAYNTGVKVIKTAKVVWNVVTSL